MEITYRDFEKLEWPIYRIPSDVWDYKDGLVYVNGKIVDDRNVKEDTIGLRRMKTPFRDKLLRLSRAITTYEGIIKYGHKYFIDTKGRLFVYTKTEKVKLQYKKIERIERKDVATYIKIKGWREMDFKVPRPPEPEMLYAGILLLKGFPWLLYEFSEIPRKDTWRLV